tara:strand:- start:23 stop:940 length:918 start_codon:yes stop_codon:yes gene_type:complete
MKKVYISTSSFAQYSEEPLKLLKSHQINYNINDKNRKLFESEVSTMLKGCVGVIAGTETYSEKILKELPDLKVISRVGVGLDNIDIEFASTRNIKVIKTKINPSIAVAELTLGLILNLLRKISEHHFLLRDQKWEKKMGSLLSGKTLGIIGLGNNGKKIVEITKGFGLEYLAFDKVKDRDFAKKHNLKYCELNKLLSTSDIITIHLSLNDSSKNLINHDTLKMMKKSAILVNTSRGEIINEIAILEAIENKKIGGLGIDVFNNEPYFGPLIKLQNVIATPHIAAYAKEIRKQMEFEAVFNLVNKI